jgi:predicted phage baseplate assembly protein
MSVALIPPLPIPPALDACGCCAGLDAETPVEVYNRPGLSAIAYRVGTHAQFKESMLAALTASGQDALAGLLTRDDDDFSIALLDAWSSAADVLTFYSERIANENYLRTATERVSVLQLARLIGYALRPGVAAGTWLAFTLEETPRVALPATPGLPVPQPAPVPIQQFAGVPSAVTIEAGVKVQSTPGPGERPQLFETVETIEARVEWNQLRPRRTRPHPASTSTNILYVEGIETNLQPGDVLLLAPAAGSATVKRVASVTPDPAARRTRVDLDSGTAPSFSDVAPPAGVTPTTTLPLDDTTVASVVFGRTWQQDDLLALAATQGWPLERLAVSIDRLAARKPDPPPLTVRPLRLRASLFGHNAPLWDSLPSNQRFDEWIENRNNDGSFKTPPVKRVPPAFSTSWDTDSFTLAIDAAGGNAIHLDTTYPGITAGHRVVLETSAGTRRIYSVLSASEVTRSAYALSAKVTRLALAPASGSSLDFALFKLRGTAVLVQSDVLELASFPLGGTLAGSSVLLDRAALGLRPGRTVIVSGERADLAGQQASEAVVIAEVTLEGGFTRLTIETGLAHTYLLDTVTINANVARATHGETVQEVLGSGDAGKAFQRFTLRQPPLTHVSAATASGATSTLEVRVNDVRWHEVPSLLGRGPAERIFVTQTSDDGVTTVQFGDGVTGARLPTGQENVRATYRRGIGVEGLVKARALDLLLTRPTGVSAVANPLAATGAEDPESLALARRNAPLTVLTLDRIVSLQDYEDFARSFAGIAKAHATWTAAGYKRGVLVTVVGPDGAEIAAGTPTHDNLLAAIDASGDPLVPVRIESYRPALFHLAALIRRHPDHLTETVQAAVHALLLASFSFDARGFNQPVMLSEVIALLHQVPGVVAVTVTDLSLSDGPAGVPEVLTAHQPSSGQDAVAQRAWVLTIDPGTLRDVRVTP